MLPQMTSLLARIGDIEARLTELGAPSGPSADQTSFAQALAQAGAQACPQKTVARAPNSATYDQLIQAAARRHGVDADLVHAVIQAESDYDPTCRSSAGALGLMQLMPGTASGLGVRDPLDPAQSIEGGVKCLRQQLDKFHDVDLALAAYNAGPGAVTRYGGIPPYRETQAYVRRVLQTLWQRKGQ
jgi:soluble lytic murein transglycosylase-like protein